MENYNVIIVGGGAAGLSAAAFSAEYGRRVLVIEALAQIGGNGIFAEEAFALCSQEQKKREISCDVDGWFLLTMEHSHWKNNARLTRALLERSGSCMDWLTAHGLCIAGIKPETVAGLGAATHYTEGMHTGRDAMRILRGFCLNSDKITVLTRTRARRLITGNDGSVIGVCAECAGEESEYYADTVIISTGGCGGNRDLIHRIIPGVDEKAFAHLRGIRMNGDGILMAEAVGGEILSDGCLENAGPTFSGNSAIMGLITKRYAVWLNKTGHRFANEAVGDNFIFGCNAVYAQPEHMCYVLIDRSMMEDALAGPVDFLAGPSAVKKGTGVIKKALEEENAKGSVCISDDLSVIAEWMGASEHTLREEIDVYNRCCEAGSDPIFLKPQELLRPLRPGGYICIRCGVDYILTHGGIRVDDTMRVLRPDGTLIPHLYAAGVDISGLDAAGYHVAMSGHSFGLSMTGGRWAAECAIAQE